PAGAAAGTTGAGGVPGASAAGVPGAPGAVAGGPSGGLPGAPGSTAGGTTTTGGTAGGSATSGGTAGGGTTGATGATGGACAAPSGGTTPGITASTVNIGLHAPLTGTGTPFPNSSFQAGAGIFWQQPGHTVCGRKVQVEFKDDTYTPAGARNVCSQMAKRDYLVIGGGGTDQIQACATDPDIQRLGVPYLSAGVTDNGLTGLSNYFAVSLTYAQQGTLVLQNAKNQGIANPAPSKVASDNVKGKNAEWAIVTAQSPNFAGARDGMEAALRSAGIPYKDYQVDQNGRYQAAATQFGQQLALNGFKTIFVDAAPGYDKATADCKKAYNGSYDDIEWALWGLSESLWSLLKDASADLTRQNFIASTEHATIPGSVYPPVDFSHHGGHFGGTGAYVQKVNCNKTEPDQNQAGSWDTVGSN